MVPPVSQVNKTPNARNTKTVMEQTALTLKKEPYVQSAKQDSICMKANIVVPIWSIGIQQPASVWNTIKQTEEITIIQH